MLHVPTSQRQFIMYEALRKGATVDELFELTKIKHYFIEQMKELVEEEEALLLSAVLFPHPVSKKDDVRIPARNTAAIFFFIIFATPFLFCSGRSCLCFFCFLYCKLSGFRAPDRICRFTGYLTRNAVQYSAKMFSSALPAGLRKIPSTDLLQRQRRFP